jgi:hypothetical protein
VLPHYFQNKPIANPLKILKIGQFTTFSFPFSGLEFAASADDDEDLNDYSDDDDEEDDEVMKTFKIDKS